MSGPRNPELDQKELNLRFARGEELAHRFAYKYKKYRTTDDKTVTVPFSDKEEKYSWAFVTTPIDGLVMHILIPKHSDDNEIHVIFRGTAGLGAALRDTESLSDIGAESFEKAKHALIDAFKQALLIANRKEFSVTIYGHSLGGADAQHFTGCLLKILDEWSSQAAVGPSEQDKETFAKINKITLMTFNSAGISQKAAELAGKHAESLIDKKKLEVTAYYLLAAGDAIQQTGETMLFAGYKKILVILAKAYHIQVQENLWAEGYYTYWQQAPLNVKCAHTAYYFTGENINTIVKKIEYYSNHENFDLVHKELTWKLSKNIILESGRFFTNKLMQHLYLFYTHEYHDHDPKKDLREETDNLPWELIDVTEFDGKESLEVKKMENDMSASKSKDKERKVEIIEPEPPQFISIKDNKITQENQPVSMPPSAHKITMTDAPPLTRSATFILTEPDSLEVKLDSSLPKIIQIIPPQRKSNRNLIRERAIKEINIFKASIIKIIQESNNSEEKQKLENFVRILDASNKKEATIDYIMYLFENICPFNHLKKVKIYGSVNYGYRIQMDLYHGRNLLFKQGALLLADYLDSRPRKNIDDVINGLPLLLDTILMAKLAIEDPQNINAINKLAKNSNDMKGKPSYWKLILGATLLITGTILMVLSLAGIGHTAGFSLFGLYAGKKVIAIGSSLIMASGIGLGMWGKRKSISKTVKQFVDTTEKAKNAFISDKRGPRDNEENFGIGFTAKVVCQRN